MRLALGQAAAVLRQALEMRLQRRRRRPQPGKTLLRTAHTAALPLQRHPARVARGKASPPLAAVLSLVLVLGRPLRRLPRRLARVAPVLLPLTCPQPPAPPAVSGLPLLPALLARQLLLLLAMMPCQAAMRPPLWSLQTSSPSQLPAQSLRQRSRDACPCLLKRSQGRKLGALPGAASLLVPPLLAASAAAARSVFPAPHSRSCRRRVFTAQAALVQQRLARTARGAAFSGLGH